MQGRRTFLKSILYTSSVMALGLGAEFGTRTKSAQAAIPVMAVIAALNVAAGIIQTFTKSDGGMMALLGAQHQTLNLLSNQLVEIQKSLAEVNAKISALPEEIRKILAAQFRNELIAEIAAATSRYADLLEASKTDPNIFLNDEVKQRVRNILELVGQRRATLSVISEGIGPETAIIAPVACALEIASQQHLGLPKAVSQATLGSYEAWLKRFMGTDDGSIANYQQISTRRHDELVTEAAQTSIGRMLKIADFRLNGPQTQTTGTSWCLFLTSYDGVEVTGDPYSVMSKTTFTLGESGARGGYVARNIGLVKNAPNAELGIKVVVYEDVKTVSANILDLAFAYNAAGAGWKRSRAGGVGKWFFGKNDAVPRSDDICYRQGGSGSMNSHSEIMARVEQSSLWPAMSQERAKFLRLLDEMNLERAKLAFAAKAQLVAANTIDRVRQFRQLL